MIKRVAAILFSLILLQVHAFALVGGPWGNSTTNVYGTYSAVLFPTTVDDVNDDEIIANSLGLFALVVGIEGISEGYAVLFVDGLTTVGPVVAIGDPDNGVINGLIETGVNLFYTETSTTTDEDGNTTTEEQIIDYLGTANGAFQAELVKTERTGNFNASTTQRIAGEAALQIDFDPYSSGFPMTYILDGYKSSSNIEDPIVPPTDFGDQNLGGGGTGGTN